MSVKLQGMIPPQEHFEVKYHGITILFFLINANFNVLFSTHLLYMITYLKK